MDHPESSHLPNADQVGGALPRIVVERTATEILDHLEAAAKRGKLAGFARGLDAGPARSHIRDFGGPFEALLECTISGTQPASLTFHVRLQTRLAWVYFIALVATVWPGVWLTDSMIRSYFTGYDYKTWMWYLPLTIPTVPWGMIVAIRKSRKRAGTEAVEIIGTIAGLVGGKLTPPS